MPPVGSVAIPTPDRSDEVDRAVGRGVSRRCRGRVENRGITPGDVTVAEDIGIGLGRQESLTGGVEQGPGRLGRHVRGLSGSVVELLVLEIAVPAVVGRNVGADPVVEGAILVDQRGEDALIVGEDEPDVAGHRVDVGDHS